MILCHPASNDYNHEYLIVLLIFIYCKFADNLCICFRNSIFKGKCYLLYQCFCFSILFITCWKFDQHVLSTHYWIRLEMQIFAFSSLVQASCELGSDITVFHSTVLCHAEIRLRWKELGFLKDCMLGYDVIQLYSCLVKLFLGQYFVFYTILIINVTGHRVRHCRPYWCQWIVDGLVKPVEKFVIIYCDK